MHLAASAKRATRSSNATEIRQFVASQLRRVIQGEAPEQISLPSIELHCSHLAKVGRLLERSDNNLCFL